MSADPDIEAIVQEFSDLLRRRLYEVRTASLGFVEAEMSTIQAAMDKLREAARSPISADPITDPISAEDSQLYHERTREKSEGSEAEDASVEASWLSVPSSAVPSSLPSSVTQLHFEDADEGTSLGPTEFATPSAENSPPWGHTHTQCDGD